jgi:hypothetical protein
VTGRLDDEMTERLEDLMTVRQGDWETERLGDWGDEEKWRLRRLGYWIIDFTTKLFQYSTANLRFRIFQG